jgi:hypothetical protein
LKNIYKIRITAMKAKKRLRNNCILKKQKRRQQNAKHSPGQAGKMP